MDLNGTESLSLSPSPPPTLPLPFSTSISPAHTLTTNMIMNHDDHMAIRLYD